LQELQNILAAKTISVSDLVACKIKHQNFCKTFFIYHVTTATDNDDPLIVSLTILARIRQ